MEELKKTPPAGQGGGAEHPHRRPRKPRADRTAPAGGGFRIGAPDILATPEILSPFPDGEEGSDGDRRQPVREASGGTGHPSANKKKPANGRKKPSEGEGKPAENKGKPSDSGRKTEENRGKPSDGGRKPADKGSPHAPEKAGAGRVPEAAKVGSERAPQGKAPAETPGAKLRIIPLGGLGEVGKNMTAVEYGNDILVIDCGIGFPDGDEMPGIDLVIPDTTYLEQNSDRVRGIVLTHGHEDHIGAIPYVLQKIRTPVYGTRLTLGIIENKLREHKLPWKAELRCVVAGDVVRLGASFSCEFIHVNHSIADACALAIRTPLGLIVHSGDFKVDFTPIEGEMTDLSRFSELGKEGVLLLLCESTNAERPGFTPSEKKVGRSLELIFTMNPDRRIVIATFSSNVHRVQQIIDTSARHGRKVAVTGRSIINIVGAAVELGYMHIPDGVLVDIADIKKYRPEELTLITTGSQGEPMSALYRMAFGDHSQVTLGSGDLVVLSASAIPGNEKLVNRIINELAKMGVKVQNDDSVEVHVSGHACQEELKLLQGLTRPRYFMPVHGEARHMVANRDLAVSMGIPPDRIFLSEIGRVLEIDAKGARYNGTVPSGIVLVDGYGVGDVGNIVLRDRKHLSQDGLIVVVTAVERASGAIVSGPDIVSRGFVYVRESDELMSEVRRIAAEAIDACPDRTSADWFEMKNRVKDGITRFLYSRTKRKPMILPIFMEV